MPRKMKKENKEHFEFLRRNGIGVKRALDMARKMTKIDKRGKK